MNIINRLVVILVVVLSCSRLNNGYSQEIKIGQKVPDTYLANIYNFKKTKGHLLSDFGNKPLIIDFWFTHCSVCIKTMPKMDSLKKEYGEKLNILLSTYESTTKISNFFKGSKVMKSVNLPTLTYDTVLEKVFPHSTAPHEIWINKDGIVEAITGHEEITRENIEKFINGEHLALKLKSEIRDPGVRLGSIPLLTIDEKYNFGSSKLYYAYISGYLPMITGGSLVYFKDGMYKLNARNKDIYLLYQFAYNLPYSIKDYQRIIDESIAVNYKPDYATHENVFCFDMMIKDTSNNKPKRMMRDELDRFFNVESATESRLLPCYVISMINKKDSLTTTGKQTDKYLEDGLYSYVNTEWSVITYDLSISSLLKYQLVDESGYHSKRVDFSILKDWSELGKVNEGLKKFNLRVSIENRPVSVLILKDKASNLSMRK